tara:strand:- start:1082 stop:1645 length:564 start_codon:yes stop_codon:yes gene_type:complete
MEAYYYHKEIMEQRGISTKDLPQNLKNYVIKFNQKKRFTKDPEKIAELQEFSQILGEKIAETEIKKQSTIKDLTSELVNETVEVFKDGGVISNNEVEDEQMEERKAESVKATSPDASFIDEMDIPEPPEEIQEIREKIQVDEEAVAEVGDTDENVESEVIQKVSEINKPTTQQEEKDDWGVLNFLKW